MSYTSLIAAIEAVITTNANNEITGEVLRTLLTNNVTPVLGDSHYKGLAIPSTNPGDPEKNEFYFAIQAGVYSNFSGVSVNAGLSILAYDTGSGLWSGTQLVDLTPYLLKGAYAGADAQALDDDIDANAANIASNTSAIGTNALTIASLVGRADGNDRIVPQNTAFFTITANTTLVQGRAYRCTPGNTDRTHSLPASPIAGDVVRVSKRDNGLGEITIDGNGNTINGDASKIIKNQYTLVDFQFDGVEWWMK